MSFVSFVVNPLLMKHRVSFIAIGCVAALCMFRPRPVFSHETLTTTVLFDREIVRILNTHCVMCHVENGPSFPLATYEQTHVQGRKIRADVIARHMPLWAAVPGYGQFINDNNLTLRETQFIVSWVEGLGPRNAGTVFTNVADQGAARPPVVRAHADFGHWQLGEPPLTRQLSANTIDAQQADSIKRTVIDLGFLSPRLVRAVEYMPSDRRVVRAAFFSIQETGQWIGSWTPWYGFAKLPSGSAYRLPAGSHVVAEIHYRGTTERVVERGTLGLFFADEPSSSGSGEPRRSLKSGVGPSPTSVSDLVLTAKGVTVTSRQPSVTSRQSASARPDATPRFGETLPELGQVPPSEGGSSVASRQSPGPAAHKVRAQTRLTRDTYALALRPEITNGVTSIEVSARRPDGGTEVLLFAKDPRPDWPTPYIFKEPVRLRAGTVLSVTAYYATQSLVASRQSLVDGSVAATPLPGVRLTVSTSNP